MIKEYLELGKLVGTHGVRGEMKLELWCDGPDFVKQFKTVYLDAQGANAVLVKSARPHKNQVLLTIENVDSIEKAEAYRNRVLYIRRADAGLREGEWFIAELIGCTVFDADDDKKIYGTISDVYNTGANDIWVIREETGREVHIPAIRDVVISVDVEQERAVIRPLKGLFDNAD